VRSLETEVAAWRGEGVALAARAGELGVA
jgi:hypothetical protein